MVFVRKIKSHDKEYWVLIHPIRKGKKITQKSKYIGKTLPPKERLERLKKEFLMEIERKKFKFFSKEDVESIENKKNIYKKELARLSPLEKEQKLKEFIIRYTYDSSKLSGLNVTLRQTSLILREGIIPKDFKSLRTAKEIENHEKGIIAITKYKGKFDLKFIEKMHKILFLGVEDLIAGKLRSELKRELSVFFKWYRAENRRLHPIELAALIHLKLISIQPFVDGNSRLSRLLMNWILWKKGYPLIDIPIEDLEDYYNVLDEYQIEKEEKPFIDYIKEKYLKS